MRFALIAASLAISGCASNVQTPEPIIRTVEVKVQVPTKCIASMPIRPALLPLDQILAMPDGPAVVTLAAQHELLWGYAAELEAVASPCVLSADPSATIPAR